MYTKKITYTDYNGNEKTETACFNLTKRELIQLQNSVEGGLDKAINKINESGDQLKIFALFDKLVLAAYGKKSDDGSKFIKNAEVTEDFVSSAAYDALFDEMTSNPNLIKDFFIGVVPADMKDNLASELNKEENK